jgi:uncharacterized protein YegP (UPF0339 family)
MQQAHSAQQVIDDKIHFLQDYPQLSKNRGRAFNYKIADDPLNVSGLEMRASRLVGIENWHRTPLVIDYTEFFEVFSENDEDGIDGWRFRLRDSEQGILFSSTRHYTSEVALQQAMEATLHAGVRRAQYQVKRNKNGRYYFTLLDLDQNVIARRRQYYSSRFEVEQLIRQCMDLLEYRETRRSGFHLVEHLLLRPITSSDRVFKIARQADCSPGYLDPYSFRATAVVPYWPQRFQNMDFRRYFEATLRSEVPAHIHLKICWVDRAAMVEFEQAFFGWLKLKSGKLFRHTSLQANNQPLSDAQNKLLDILQNLNSIYPQSQLFDCRLEGDTQSILLNQSKLGSNEGH